VGLDRNRLMTKDQNQRVTKPRIALIFFGAGLLLLLSIAFTFIAGQIVLTSNRKIAEELTIIEQLERTFSILKDLETGQRGFLLTGSEEYLQSYHTGFVQIQAQFADLDALANRKALDGGLLAQLKQEIEAKLSEMEQTIRLRRDQTL